MVEVNMKDNEGCTPIHYASSASVLQALLVFDADYNVYNNKVTIFITSTFIIMNNYVLSHCYLTWERLWM